MPYIPFHSDKDTILIMSLYHLNISSASVLPNLGKVEDLGSRDSRCAISDAIAIFAVLVTSLR